MKVLLAPTVMFVLLLVTFSVSGQEWISWKSQQVPQAQPVETTPQDVVQTEATAETTVIERRVEPASTSQVLPQQVKSPASIVLLPSDISKPYDILGNVEVEVKGRDSEQEAKSTLQQQAQTQFGDQVDAIIYFKSEMRVANILAGYALKGGFKWKATGVAVKFK